MDFELEIKRIRKTDAEEMSKLLKLLEQEGIALDESVTYTAGIYLGDELLATGSYFQNTLRSLAVSSAHQGLGLMNKMVSHLQERLYAEGQHHLFLYTKYALGKLFTDLGFYEIASVEDLVIFMENRPDGIARYKRDIASKQVAGEHIAAIVMNANPFTLGHQYLVEKAASENDAVHLFVVSEEASIIPFDIRYELIAKGVAHLPNVILHSAGVYMVSKTTFPSYFLQGEETVVRAHAALDIEIFLRHVVPSLGITKRYVGDEPYCAVTRTYIEMMKQILENRGVACEIVHRKETASHLTGSDQAAAISASMVRNAIKNNQLEDIRQIVPETTFDFFKSTRGQALIEKIKLHSGRH